MIGLCAVLLSQEAKDQPLQEESRYSSRTYFPKVPLRISDTVDVHISAPLGWQGAA
jgi:hypothetical protein